MPVYAARNKASHAATKDQHLDNRQQASPAETTLAPSMEGPIGNGRNMAPRPGVLRSHITTYHFVSLYSTYLATVQLQFSNHSVHDVCRITPRTSTHDHVSRPAITHHVSRSRHPPRLAITCRVPRSRTPRATTSRRTSHWHMSHHSYHIVHWVGIAVTLLLRSNVITLGSPTGTPGSHHSPHRHRSVSHVQGWLTSHRHRFVSVVVHMREARR